MKIAPPIARALRLSVFEGSMFSIYWNVVAGVVMNGLALAAGAGGMAMAVLNALPLLGQVPGLFAARLLQGRDIRKPLTLWAEGISRGIWLLVPLLALLPEGPLRVALVLGIAGVSHVIHSAGAVGWISWVSDIVPEPIRGAYFGVRAAISGLVGLLGLTLASVWADHVRAVWGEGPAYVQVLLVLVAASVAFAALSWVGLLLQPVRRMRRRSEPGWGPIWRTLRGPNARRIAWAWVALAFSAGITTGVFMPFFLRGIRMSFLGITAYAWIALGVSTAMTPLMGRLGDRIGHRNVLLIAWLGVFWQPLLSVFTPDDMPHLLGLMPVTILVDALAGGCFWPAVGVAQTNLAIGEASSEHRAGLFAVLSALGGTAGFLGAMVGGGLADAIGPGHSFEVLGLPADHLRFPMILGAGLRALALLTILRVREPPHTRPAVTSAQAFTVVWRVVSGKPIRPPAR